MTPKEYLEFHKNFCERMVAITTKKNADYTGNSEEANGDPFKNFRLIETLGVCSAEAGFITRMSDKLARISTFVKKGILLVSDESVEDTLLDLANYSALLAAYLKEKRTIKQTIAEAVVANVDAFANGSVCGAGVER